MGFKTEPDGATVLALIRLKRGSIQINTWCYMGIVQLFINYSLPVSLRENFYGNKMFKFGLSIKKVLINFLMKVQISEIFILKA